MCSLPGKHQSHLGDLITSMDHVALNDLVLRIRTKMLGSFWLQLASFHNRLQTFSYNLYDAQRQADSQHCTLQWFDVVHLYIS